MTPEQLRALTDDDLDALRIAVLTEQERRYKIENAPAQMEAVATDYAAAVADDDPVPFEPVPHFGHGPGTLVIFDGETHRNTSGAWLTASPADYPLGWSQETGLPDDVPPFKAGENVVPGDLREYEGTIYRVIQGHTTAAHWPPPATPALWAPQG